MKRIYFACVFAVVALVATSVQAAPPKTEVIYFGHAAFEIVTPKGQVLLIDPWLKNPLNPHPEVVNELKRVDYILISHGHFDHVGDAVALAKRTGAHLVTNFELGTNLVRLLGYPAKQVGIDTLGNIGGELSLGDGEVVVALVPAVHSGGIDAPDGASRGTPVAYGGNPVGFVVRIKNGPTIYHSGDTAFFSDMALIGENYSLDLALLNIGGHFGMEPDMAARAASAVKAKWVVPHHYKTMPLLTQDPKPFFQLLDKRKIAYREMAPGQSLFFEGHMLRDTKVREAAVAH